MKRTTVSYCMFCAQHSHSLCRGGECECGARRHDPEVRVAAAMRVYTNPARCGADEVQLANEWRTAE